MTAIDKSWLRTEFTFVMLGNFGIVHKAQDFWRLLNVLDLKVGTDLRVIVDKCIRVMLD